MSLALVTPNSSERSLDDLAALVNAAHQLVEAGRRQTVEHAIAAGENLLEAKTRFTPRTGEWMAWLRGLECSNTRAHVYMRLAKYEVHARDEPTIESALRAIKGKRATRSHSTQGTIDQAKDLRAEGMTQRAIAEALGVSVGTVSKWFNGNAYRNTLRQQDRQRKARRALERQERDALARRRGGSVAEAYSLIRKAAQELDRARSGAANADARRHIGIAESRLLQVEEAIVRALGASA